MTDEQVEKIIKSNMMLQMNLAGIRADFEEALQRTWVGLTDEVKQEWIDAMPNPPQPRHFMVLVNAIESELKEKNT
jgi:hypothetical protein